MTHVRGTWIVASVASLRREGLFETYASLLPLACHEAIVHAVPAEWVEIRLAMEHYRACDRLALSRATVAKRGVAISDSIQASLLDIVVRLAKGAGITPWTVFDQYPRIWARVYMGGAIAVNKVGPKEAIIEIVGVPLLEFDYFRQGLKGVLSNINGKFCRKGYMSDVANHATTSSAVLRYAWA